MNPLQQIAPTVPKPALRQLTLALAKELRRAGAPAHRVEDQMAAFADAVGSDLRVFVFPGAILCSVRARTAVLDVHPGPPDLDRLSTLEELADEVASGRATPEEALLHLEDIEKDPRPFGPFATLLAFAIASATAVPFFGGGANEALAALLVGGVSGVLTQVLGGRAHATHLIEVAAAAIGAFLLAGIARVVPLVGEAALICGLIVLLPGFSLTTALTELATRHRVSGTSGLAAGGLVLMQLGFGVALGSTLAAHAFGPTTFAAVTATPLPAALYPVAVTGVALAFGALLQARPHHLPQVLGATILALSTLELARPVLGGELAGGVAALAVTVAANSASRHLEQPSAVWQLPGILILVPGSIGFRSVTALLDHDVLAGVEGAFGTALAAMALVGGSLLGSALVPPRKAL